MLVLLLLDCSLNGAWPLVAMALLQLTSGSATRGQCLVHLTWEQ